MKRASALILLLAVAGCNAVAQVKDLPPPVVHGSSFEIISNSRYSSHWGFTDLLSDTVLSNVLWATSRVPSFGSSYREIYVATSTNVYLYDPIGHVLNVHLAGDHRYLQNNSPAAFEVGIAVERNEEAGLMVQAGLLAGSAFWSVGSGIVTSCPTAEASNYADTAWDPNHTINMVDLFGRKSVTGLTDSCVAHSSDSTLPDPATDGADTFELLISGLGQDSIFDSANLSLSTISQLLWAGYGQTPHQGTGGARALTVPSAGPYYYLTTKIYLVRDVGVDRYHNRLPPGTNFTTRDHRLEEVTSGDRRDSLRAACPSLPETAPVYVVVCVTDTTYQATWKLQEAGFAGFQYLMQAHALGLHGRLTAPISPAERAAIIAALGLPSADMPVIIFTAGLPPLPGVAESDRLPSERLEVERTQNGARLSIQLIEAGLVRLVIYDLAGRPVRSWEEVRLSAGAHGFEWDGSSDNGKSLPSGPYFCRLTLGRAEPVVLLARVDIAR
jgi:hypothetical protein